MCRNIYIFIGSIEKKRHIQKDTQKVKVSATKKSKKNIERYHNDTITESEVLFDSDTEKDIKFELSNGNEEKNDSTSETDYETMSVDGFLKHEPQKRTHTDMPDVKQVLEQEMDSECKDLKCLVKLDKNEADDAVVELENYRRRSKQSINGTKLDTKLTEGSDLQAKEVLLARKSSLIDFLKTDFNAISGTETSTMINFYDQNVSEYSETWKIVEHFAEKVVDLYNKLTTMSAWTLIEENKNICPFCNLPITEKTGVQKHVQKHQKKLEERCMEWCKHCNVILPRGYMKCHPCIKKTKLQNHKVKICMADMRDFVAFIEMKQQFCANTKFECHMCTNKLADICGYKNHYVNAHGKMYQCKCDRVFASKEEVILHMRPVTCKDRTSAKQCRDCKETFQTTEELHQHLKLVHQITGDITCQHCGHHFACESGLEIHKCVKKKRKGTYHCNVDACTERFPSYRSCMKHKLEKHGIKKYLCNLCGQTFLVSSTLTTHQEWAHGIGESKECKVCHQTFPGPNTLRSHMLSHSSESKYSCEICGKVYKYRAGLKIHKDTAHNKNQEKKLYTCEVCGIVYAKKGSLNHHIIMTNHTGVNQIAALKWAKKCNHCGKMFGCNRKLQRHISQVHVRDKQLVCQFCGKCFSDPSNLRQHKQTHTGGKPTCDVCKVTFRSRRKLCEHMLEAHNIHMELAKFDPYRNKSVNTSIENGPLSSINKEELSISNEELFTNSKINTKLTLPSSLDVQESSAHCSEAPIQSPIDDKTDMT